MDYEGKYFPDEDEDEKEQSKGGKIFKKTIRYIVYGISFLVYAIFIYRIIVSSDLDLIEQMIFTAETRSAAAEQGDGFELYDVFPHEFMNEDGSIQISDCYYAAGCSQYELGIKYNNRLTGGSSEEELFYTLTDSEGNEYELVSRVRDIKDKYVYERICFEGMTFDLDMNLVNRTEEYSDEYSMLYEEGLAMAESDAEEFAEEYAESALAGTVYTLSIYRADEETLMFSTDVYSNNFYISEAEYESPDSEYVG